MFALARSGASAANYPGPADLIPLEAARRRAEAATVGQRRHTRRAAQRLSFVIWRVPAGPRFPNPRVVMNEKQLQALIKKMEKQAKPKAKPQRWNDPTLAATQKDAEEAVVEAKEIFKEMKRREF